MILTGFSLVARKVLRFQRQVPSRVLCHSPRSQRRLRRSQRQQSLLVSPARDVSVAHQLMVFHPRPRSWLPTCHTILLRIRYDQFYFAKTHSLTALQLKELFAAYEPVSAKIALRPIPRFMVKKLQARNEPRKGRGFGFVTLATEEQQQKAVNEMNGKEIEGREIAVKVAIDSPDKTDEDANAPAAEAAAETDGTTTTTTTAAPVAA